MATAPSSRRRAKTTANKRVSPRPRPPAVNGPSDALLRTWVAAMGDLVFILDSDGRFLEAHTTRSNFLQFSSDEMIGRRLDELFPADERTYLTLNLIHRALETRQTVS